MRLVPHTQVNARLGCYYIVNFFQALQPSVYAWATLNTAGQTKKVSILHGKAHSASLTFPFHSSDRYYRSIFRCSVCRQHR